MNYELMTQKELLELILDAEKKYYETGERTISDAVYEVTIQKASLGSRANLDKLGIDIGDTIKVCLANSVIPQILGRA